MKIRSCPLWLRLSLFLVCFAAALPLPALCYYWLTEGPLLKVRHLSIIHSLPLKQKSLLGWLDDLKGSPLYGVKVQEAELKIKQLPWVKSVQLLRILPSELWIEIKERKPIAKIKQNHQTYHVCSDGIVFESAYFAHYNEILPELIFSSLNKDEINLAILAVMSHAKANQPGGLLKQVEVVTSGDVVARFSNGLEVFLGAGHLHQKWTILGFIIKQLGARANELIYVYLDKYPYTNQIPARFHRAN